MPSIYQQFKWQNHSLFSEPLSCRQSFGYKRMQHSNHHSLPMLLLLVLHSSPLFQEPQFNTAAMTSSSFSALLFALWALLLASAVRSQTDGCSVDPSSFLPFAYNVSALACRPIWNDFVLRYSQSEDNVLTIVLSKVYTVGWVGMGFSKDGMMVGSSAMVGWIGKTGRPHIKQFYLRGQTTSEVQVNESQLLTVGNPPVVLVYMANIYLAFQLKFPAPVTKQELLFAFGTAIPVDNRLKKHTDRTSISFDFSAGTSSASAYPYQLKKSHGVLNIFGWGVLLPIGAIIARYCKQRDLLWYYLHATIQFIGFFVGFAGVVAGIALYDRLHANVSAHRGLGIFILVLGILQLLAFFLRPEKDSKMRRYWNWYHHWVGRFALFLAAVNIFLGIQVGGADDSWKVGYSVNLAILLITTIILEVLLWTRWSKKTVDPPTFQPTKSSTFQMNKS